MQPLRVVRRGLDRMPESVSEVKQGAITALALVAPDDLRLDLTRTLYGVRQRFRSDGQQLVNMSHEPAEKCGIADQPVLYDFGESGTQLAGGQGGQCRGVSDNGARL